MAEVIVHQTPAQQPQSPTRRVVLGRLAAASAIGTATGVAAAGAADPHIVWLEEWLRLRDWINSPVTHPGLRPDQTAEFWRWLELEEWIAATPAKSLEGLAAQAEVLADSYQLMTDEEPDATHNAAHNLRRSLRELVGQS